jgi:thymidylate synthase
MKFTNKDLHPDGRPLLKEEFINKIKTDDEFAKKWGELGPIYGQMWRDWDADTGEKIDQIANLISDLKTNPDSRRLMLSAWNPTYIPHCVLPPCHYGFQVYTRELSNEERYSMVSRITDKKIPVDLEGKEWIVVDNIPYKIPTRAISLMWNQRSVDTFLGLPFNIASYGLLLEIIAKEVNMVPDELIGNLGDVHLYSNHIEQAKELLTRTPYYLPKLKIHDWYSTQGHPSNDAELITRMFDSIEPISIRFSLENYQSHPAIKAPLSN